jgi:oligopeptide transport system permease protein
MNLLRFLVRRVVYLVVTLWLIISVTFLLMHMLPGSPYVDVQNLSAEQIAILDARYGLDQPLWQQYLLYFGNLLQGDFGVSFQFRNQPVSALLEGKIWPSLQLGLQAFVLGVVLGTILGAVSAVRRGTVLDSVATVFSVTGRSVPGFVIAALLQFVFAVQLSLLPIAAFDSSLRSTLLPTIALAMLPLAESARFVRTEMVEALSSDYAMVARAKGFGPWRIAWRHGLRNSLIPLLTVLGPVAVALVTGSLVVENIFAVPGIGEQFVRSVLLNDYPTIMAVTIFYSALLLTVLLVIDVLYMIVDPRIRLSGSRR